MKHVGQLAGLAVVQVGAWPPPIGGVTVHVRRLSLLLRDRGCRVRVIDVSGRPKAFPSGIKGSVLRGPRILQVLGIAAKLARIPRDALVHVHVSALGSVRILLPIAPAIFRHRLILTIHGGSFTDWSNQMTPRERKTLRRLLDAVNRVVVVNEDQRQALIDRLHVPAERISVVPAFLLEREPEPAPLPDLPPGDAPLALVSGIGVPIYWWEGLLDAVERMGSKLRWALSVYMEYAPGYFDEIQRRAAALPNVALIRDLDPPAFQNLLAHSDLFVRPTLVDGDSVALREALAAGKPVVASDAVPRPAGVTLFRSEDVDDLVRVVTDAVERLDARPPETTTDFSEEILDVYAQVAGG